MAAESSSSTSVQEQLRPCFLRMCSASKSHHSPPCACHVYGGNSQPGVELKCLCNDVGCTAEKNGNFEYANARASAREVTVSKPFLEQCQIPEQGRGSPARKPQGLLALEGRDRERVRCKADGGPLHTKVYWHVPHGDDDGVRSRVARRAR